MKKVLKSFVFILGAVVYLEASFWVKASVLSELLPKYTEIVSISREIFLTGVSVLQLILLIVDFGNNYRFKFFLQFLGFLFLNGIYGSILNHYYYLDQEIPVNAFREWPFGLSLLVIIAWVIKRWADIKRKTNSYLQN